MPPRRLRPLNGQSRGATGTPALRGYVGTYRVPALVRATRNICLRTAHRCEKNSLLRTGTDRWRTDKLMRPILAPPAKVIYLPAHIQYDTRGGPHFRRKDEGVSRRNLIHCIELRDFHTPRSCSGKRTRLFETQRNMYLRLVCTPHFPLRRSPNNAQSSFCDVGRLAVPSVIWLGWYRR